jgi:hypothetical protein
VVGDKSYCNAVGPEGLGKRKQTDQMLIHFCERNLLVTTNTQFKKPKIKLYTWKAPEGRNRHQLDNVLVKHQFRDSMKDMHAVPGAGQDLH